MKAILESTSKMVTMNGVPCRIWEGVSDGGVPFLAFITRVAVKLDADNSQFEKELKETKSPSAEAQAYPLRMIL